MSTANIQPTGAVRGQGYMRRDDGMLLPFNPDIWNGDQRTKKRWVRLAEMPADYVEAQNFQKEQEGLRLAELEAARELAEERKAQAKVDQAAGRKRARTTPIKITPAMRAAQRLADGQQNPAALKITEMSQEQITDVMRDVYHTTANPSWSLDQARLEFAKLTGTPVE